MICITEIITAISRIRALSRIATWHLNEISCSVAMTPNSTQVYVKAETLSKQRCLPIHKRVAEIINWVLSKVNSTSSTEGYTVAINRNKFCRPVRSYNINHTGTFDVDTTKIFS